MYEEKIVLCGANSYEEKYYLNPDFSGLPDHIKDELKIMCVLYVHDVGGILTLVYEENGELCFEVTSEEGDWKPVENQTASERKTGITAVAAVILQSVLPGRRAVGGKYVISYRCGKYKHYTRHFFGRQDLRYFPYEGKTAAYIR